MSLKEGRDVSFPQMREDPAKQEEKVQKFLQKGEGKCKGWNKYDLDPFSRSKSQMLEVVVSGSILETTAYVLGKIPERWGLCLTSFLVLWGKVLLGDFHTTELEVVIWSQRGSEAETVLILCIQPPTHSFLVKAFTWHGKSPEVPMSFWWDFKGKELREPVGFLWDCHPEEWGDPKQAFLNKHPKPRSFRRCGYEVEDL